MNRQEFNHAKKRISEIKESLEQLEKEKKALIANFQNAKSEQEKQQLQIQMKASEKAFEKLADESERLAEKIKKIKG